MVFAAMMGDHRVVLESARLRDWIATRAEPLARSGAGCRECAGWAAEGAGSNTSTSAKKPSGAPMRYVESFPNVAAEAYA
jgi:hypothetical protein